MTRFYEGNLIHRKTQIAILVCVFLVFTVAITGQIVAQSVPAASNSTNETLPDLDLSTSAASQTAGPLAVTPNGSNQLNSVQAGVPSPVPINALTTSNTSVIPAINPFQQRMETALYLRKTRQFNEAEKVLVSLLGNDSPENIQKSALLELAALAQDQDDLPRAQDIYAQFLNRWPDEARIPEILLRQGQIFRQMGMSEMALNKFYAVMTTALTLKDSQLDLYKSLVLQAQIEIADTHYDLGKYGAAAEFFSRLLNQDNPAIDKPQILYRLVCCYNQTTNYDQAIASAESFLGRFPGAPEEPEVRFNLALALNQLGRHNDALLQVLNLLKEQSAQAKDHPEVWVYWRQRAGNLIGNQLYEEGDFTRALDIYTSLAQLDSSPQWQLPVWYQMGLTYERLWQPQEATAIYKQIINREQALGTNAAPSLATIANMAQWRIGFIQWQSRAEDVNHDLHQLNAAIAKLQPSTNSSP